MALELSKVCAYGVPANYWKIVSIVIDVDSSILVKLKLYIDQQKSSESAAVDSKEIRIDLPLDWSKLNIFEYCYTKIKENKEFLSAIDV